MGFRLSRPSFYHTEGSCCRFATPSTAAFRDFDTKDSVESLLDHNSNRFAGGENRSLAIEGYTDRLPG